MDQKHGGKTQAASRSCTVEPSRCTCAQSSLILLATGVYLFFAPTLELKGGGGGGGGPFM